MAISSTRIKFRDKENKVLVKGLKDIKSNDIISNIVTPVLVNDLLTQVEGLGTLLDLQDNLSQLHRELKDKDLSQFNVKKVIGNLSLANPEFAQAAGAITAVRKLNKKDVGVFMTSLLEVTAQGVQDNPSMLQSPKEVSNQVKANSFVNALESFGKKVISGGANMSSVSRDLKQIAAGSDELGMRGVSEMIHQVQQASPEINAALELEQNFKLSDRFFKDKTPAPVTTTLNDRSDIDALLVAYLSVKREYYRRVAALRMGQLMTAFPVDRIASDPVTLAALEAYLGVTTYHSYITVCFDHEAFLSCLRTQLSAALVHHHSLVEGVPLPEAELLRLRLVKSVESALRHPYLRNLAQQRSDVFVYLDSPLPFHTTDSDTAASLVVAKGYIDDVIDLTVVKYLQGVKNTRDVEELCLPVLVTKYRTLLRLLQTGPWPESSHYATGFMQCMEICTSLFTISVRRDVAQCGVNPSLPLIPPTLSSRFGGYMETLVKTLSLSLIGTLAPEAVVSRGKEAETLYTFFARSFPQRTGITAAAFNEEAYLLSFHALMVEQPVPSSVKYAMITPLILDAEKYTTKAVDLERIAFCGGKVRIT